MKQMHIAEELDPEVSSVQIPKYKIRQRLIGELNDGGLIEINGKAYVQFSDRDLFFELQGSGQLNEFFVFGKPIKVIDKYSRLLMSAVRTGRS